MGADTAIGGQSEATWYAGGSTASTRVTVRRERDEAVIVFPDGRTERRRFAGAKASQKIKGVPLRVEFDDGASLVVPDGENALRLYQGISALPAWFERRLLISIPVLLGGAFVILFLFVEVIVPALAARIAENISVDSINDIGDAFFERVESGLNLELHSTEPEHVEAQERLREIGDEIVQVAGGEGFNYEFFIETGKPWPNAFTLPNGHIVMTYELYEALTEDEIAAVLAHEIAHVIHRHSMEAMIRISAWFVVSEMMLAGSSALTALPALAELSYSREHEFEADCVGAELLEKAGRPAVAMADALESLAAEVGVDLDEEDQGATPLDLLRTHPKMDERLDYASQCAGHEGWVGG